MLREIIDSFDWRFPLKPIDRGGNEWIGFSKANAGTQKILQKPYALHVVPSFDKLFSKKVKSSRTAEDISEIRGRSSKLFEGRTQQGAGARRRKRCK